ncbi:MAG: hypothetical protein FWC43_12805, partial [Planctomycetaceae bacterium]|nr:hypothetical protein [Planctomycetaceae bacterium]
LLCFRAGQAPPLTVERTNTRKPCGSLLVFHALFVDGLIGRCPTIFLDFFFETLCPALFFW